MTRWEHLLEALGVSAREFEMWHDSKFDQSPREWLKERLKEMALPPRDELLPDSCTAFCCKRV